MNFKDEILKYENKNSEDIFIINIGSIPVLLSAPHTIEQTREDGSIKYREPFTKAIALYVADKTNSSSIIKMNDNGIDPNHVDNDEYKDSMLKIIEDNSIQLVLDIHGAKRDREFDIELGTMNNLSADFSTINELKESFIENGINRIEVNNPFKGGNITQTLYFSSNVDVIQIEINNKYRDINEEKNIEKVCKSIINFIYQYINK